jgi:serine/threonine protein kinase
MLETSASHGNYLVMEFIDGETLQRRLQKGPLQLKEAITIASQIAGALAAAHRNGIVHRDLKPQHHAHQIWSETSGFLLGVD